MIENIGVVTRFCIIFSIQNWRASMLMALPPVIILPISYFAFKEKFRWQATLGTAFAVAGAAIFFLA